MYAYQNRVPVFGQAGTTSPSRARMWNSIRIGALVVGGVGAVVLVVKGRLLPAAGVAVAGLLGAGVAREMQSVSTG